MKKVGHTSAHPGFAGAQKAIAARDNVSSAGAAAILASATRNASATAKKRNPFLKKVKK